MRFEDRVAHVVRLHLRHRLALVRWACGSCLRICCTRGLSASVLQELAARDRRTSRRAGSRTSPSPTSSESTVTRGLASRSTASRNMSKIAASMAAFARVERVFATRRWLSSSLRAEGADRIGLLPPLDLFLRAIARRIGRRVAADAVGDRVEQHRAAALVQHLLLAAEGIDHRQRIVAVDALGVHLLRVDAGADARDELRRPSFRRAAGRPCRRSCSCS